LPLYAFLLLCSYYSKNTELNLTEVPFTSDFFFTYQIFIQ